MKLSLRLVAVLLLLGSGQAFAQYRSFIGGKNKIRYDTFEWKIYETPHFRISYYDRVEPSLERIASYAESAYDELARKLNFQILEPIPLITYATHAEFEQTNVIVAFIPEGIGAFASPVRNRMVLPVDLADAELQALIQHELTHIFQYEILFQGRTGRAIYRRPPNWFMEGMASYLAFDESARERAYMRDAALTDRVPSVMNAPEGYLAYRYGHKVFEYVEAEWGEDGLRDFIFAFRNTLGGRIGGPFEKALNLTPEEFDSAFRTWLRKSYAAYGDRGGPEEFGRRFRGEEGLQAWATSPVASPSGDLIAAFSTYKNDVDVVLYGVPDRRLYRNLTKGATSRYQYLVAQGLTVGGDRGRDLAFSPDGNRVAVFARFERTRKLVLLDANKGGIAREIDIPLPIDQPAQPAFSPDGRTVAFRGFREGHSDIYLLDLGDESIVNLTQDDAYDAAPAFAPDGRTVIYTTQTGEWCKLVQLELADPGSRRQLTFGPGNDEGPVLSLDGKRIYFTSDRKDGVLDVYQFERETLALSRLTHVTGAAINPMPVQTLDGERVVVQAFSRSGWDLYVVDPARGVPVGTAEPSQDGVDLAAFLPAVTIPVDPERGVPLGRRKLYLDAAYAFVGYDQYGTISGQIAIAFTDQYGDRRFDVLLDSVDTFSNFRLSYINLEPRLQWGGTIFDDRSFYIWGYDPNRDEYTQRQETYRQTGGALIGWYPLSRSYRLEGSLGFVNRQAVLPAVDENGEVGFESFTDNVPFAGIGVAGDTTVSNYYGPHSGARWELDFYYGADLDGGGTLTANVTFDGRTYLPLSQRNEIALRLWAAYAEGNRPSIFAFGGMDTVHGYPIQSIAGNRAAFVSAEWRFPLIDRLDFAFMSLGGIRGRAFVGVGAAYYSVDGIEYDFRGEPGFDFTVDGRLEDGVASYGVGLTVGLFGLPLNFDFVRRWDFEHSLSGTEVDFWVGYKF